MITSSIILLFLLLLKQTKNNLEILKIKDCKKNIIKNIINSNNKEIDISLIKIT